MCEVLRHVLLLVLVLLVVLDVLGVVEARCQGHLGVVAHEVVQVVDKLVEIDLAIAVLVHRGIQPRRGVAAVCRTHDLPHVVRVRPIAQVVQQRLKLILGQGGILIEVVPLEERFADLFEPAAVLGEELVLRSGSLLDELKSRRDGDLLLLDAFDHRSELLVLIRVEVAIDQVATERQDAAHQADQGGGVLPTSLLFCVIAPEFQQGGGDLHHEIEQRRAEHDLGAGLDAGSEGDAAAHERGLPLVRVVGLPIFKRNSAEDDANEPREREQHDGATRQRSHADGDRLLRIRPDAGEEDHHAIGHRA
mmetsp:Transcript_68869/g.194367  ORF Transcript_68869/g.194367 Transcript_68869/m.194367 type:complete len:306 (-) Transcript_68869:258-1175(-)